ncbi:MAG: hypothetical protein AAB553_00505 [Patescibacteria group bacterium]
MDENTQPAFIDMTLSPNNAKEKGYRYVDDVLYDMKTMHAYMIEVKDLINNEGYKLGRPSKSYMETYYGLYEPVTKEK